MPSPAEQEVNAPFAGVVVAVEHTSGASVQAGTVLVVLEAMKMEHEVLAESDGIVRRVEVAAGDAIEAGDLLVVLTTDDPPANGAREVGSRPDAKFGGAHEGGAFVDVEFGGARKGGAFVDTGFEDAPDGAPVAGTKPDAAPGRSEPTAARAARAARGSDAAGAEGDDVRADLAAVRERHALGLDAARPEAVQRRRARGRRTARENLADLVDEDSYVEYGPLLFAAQERRRPKQELIERTPADGLVAGVAEVDGNPCVAMSYDYTVLAGTQGMRGHLKKDRLFELAERRRLPVVLFAEGGGGRPGDVDFPIVAGLDCRAFHLFGRLSGLVPLVGIASGYCFAGNAALLGCCDVVIATEDSSIGMGGPAMIEGGGLGVHEPGEVGPIDVQHANGVVDLRVADDQAAVAAAKRYLSYFHGPVEQQAAVPDRSALYQRIPDQSAPDWSAPDQRLLREIVPEQRKRAYEVRRVLHTLCDEDSVMELRDGFGAGMVTALARIEGRPLGVLANDPAHLGGAIDADAADKAARFLQLCDAFGLPVLFLCDTPGFMVGPDAERTATVRHFSRLFVTGANLEIPFGTIVLRKGYGLGAQAMAGGSFKAPLFCVGWPTSEFGGMGLEGAVRLGMRRELDAIEDPEERERVFQATVAAAYEHGEGLNMAAYGEIDDVIDPADSRRWIATLLDPPPVDWRKRAGKRRPNIDAW
jgi:acetyl-CoA carboxylase carboxyltransferase component